MQITFRTTPLMVLFGLVFLVTACQARPAQAPPTATAGLAPTRTRPALAALLTPTPTAPLPSATPSEVFTPTPTPSDTPASTPDPVLADARLLGVSWQPGYNLLLSIQFAEPVSPEDYRVVVEGKEEYACQVIAQHPDRLYCIGRGRNVYGRINVQIFPAGSDIPGFEGRIYVPYFTD